MPRLRWIPLVLAALMAPATGLAATLVLLDAMTQSFPPNPCLPVSHQQSVFIGSLCDGAACPPGTVVTACSGSGNASNVLSPPTAWTRETSLFPINGTVPPTTDCRAFVAAADGRVRFACTAGDRYAVLNLRYFPSPPLDLLAGSEMRITVEGNITPQTPLQCYVLLQGTGKFATSVAKITAPGDLVFPFSSFQQSPGFTFGLVSYVYINFGDCDAGGCRNIQKIPDFSAGNLRFESAATATASSSWGRLKSLYR